MEKIIRVVYNILTTIFMLSKVGYSFHPTPFGNFMSKSHCSHNKSFHSFHKTVKLNAVSVTQSEITLNDGTIAEIIKTNGVKNKNKPPLIFIHGSFHAAWCWAEHYLPFFASKGYNGVAVCLRGTGGTFAGEGIKKVKVMQHVEDIQTFINNVTQESKRPPVLISHSFSGIAVMKYLEQESINGGKEQLSGIAMLCSVPPSGNGKMTLRYLKRSLADSWQITAGFVLQSCMTDKVNCRTLFFGGVSDEDDRGIDDEDLERYQGYFRRDSQATLDLADLNKQLPSKLASEEGNAPFAHNLPPTLVLGASDDFIVDQIGVQETASYFGVEPVMVNSPHDVMLGRDWMNGAQAILQWLQDLPRKP